jgi:hypothetical protein
MATEDAKQLDTLLVELCEADHELRKAIMMRKRAHAAVLSFVAQRVPAGTSDGALDIPAFLRSEESRGKPEYPHSAGLAPLIGCNCEYCTAARSRATLGL